MATVKLLTYDVYRQGMTLFKDLADQTYQSIANLPEYYLRRLAVPPTGYDSAYRLFMYLPQTGEEFVHGDTLGIMGASGGGVIFCYIIGNTPFALDWLSTETGPSAEPLIPDENFLYLIQTPGEYMNMFCKYDSVQQLYVPVIVSGSGGSGAIFSYIVGNTPLAADWLSDEVGGSPIEPKEGPLYLVLTAGLYYSGFYRFDETQNKYILVGNARVVELTEAEYLALPAAKQLDGTIYFITDGADSTPTSDDYVPSRATVPDHPQTGLTILWKGAVGGDFTVSPAFYTYRSGHWQFEDFDISGDTIQADPLPTASADIVGKVMQFVGTTTASYTHGYFYECVSAGGGTYSWSNIPVQSGESIQFTTMPAASAELLGKVYQYIGTTTQDFKHNYFYECVNDNGYKWNQCSVMDGESIQFTTMPAASAALLGKVYQYIGATTQDFTHGYFYECVNDGGTYKWNKVVVSKGGHDIFNDGTVVTSRDVLNFTGFDVSDDATDEETDIKSHRLTTAEMDEIFENEPSGEVGLPVLFDDTGAERVVGWYRTSAGKKPVYETNYIISVTSATTPVELTFNTDADFVLDVSAVLKSLYNDGSGNDYALFLNHAEGQYYINIATRIGSHKMIIAKNQTWAGTAYITIRYTKTTDTPI